MNNKLINKTHEKLTYFQNAKIRQKHEINKQFPQKNTPKEHIQQSPIKPITLYIPIKAPTIKQILQILRFVTPKPTESSRKEVITIN